MPPQRRHETREIGRYSKIERAVSPSNGQLGAAEALDQTLLKSLSEGEIILPPIGDQLQYVERLAELSDTKLAASTADHREQALFTSLQHRAFRGEL